MEKEGDGFVTCVHCTRFHDDPILLSCVHRQHFYDRSIDWGFGITAVIAPSLYVVVAAEPIANEVKLHRMQP